MWVAKTALPQEALLQRYARQPGCYTDCYRTRVRGPVDLERYIEAFYKTPLFRGERVMLAAMFKSPSSDADLTALAQGSAETFAAWRVEDRAADQILLQDIKGRTRSWLMVREDGKRTELLFGSAVVPVDGAKTLGRGMRMLLPFHRLYARALLRAARRALYASMT